MLKIHLLQVSQPLARFAVKGSESQVYILAIISKAKVPMFIARDCTTGLERYVDIHDVSEHLAKVIPLFKPAPAVAPMQPPKGA